MHGHGHKTKNVLNTRTNLGFAAVILFLLGSQRPIAIPFFTNFVLDMLRQLLFNISTVSIIISVACIADSERIAAFLTLDKSCKNVFRP